jgi:hypothetical protein
VLVVVLDMTATNHQVDISVRMVVLAVVAVVMIQLQTLVVLEMFLLHHQHRVQEAVLVVQVAH